METAEIGIPIGRINLLTPIICSNVNKKGIINKLNMISDILMPFLLHMAAGVIVIHAKIIELIGNNAQVRFPLMAKLQIAQTITPSNEIAEIIMV